MLESERLEVSEKCWNWNKSGKNSLAPSCNTFGERSESESIVFQKVLKRLPKNLICRTYLVGKTQLELNFEYG